MMHSSYLNTRLRLYTQKGRSRLDNLLAKMGISQDHARQAWTHTPVALKRDLSEKVEKVQGGMGLEMVQEGGFERSWGFKGVWSAGDVVEVIEALLVLSPGGSEGKENVKPSEDAGAKERFRAREGEMKAEWVARFYRALDAVDK
jgi:cell division control protein 45